MHYSALASGKAKRPPDSRPEFFQPLPAAGHFTFPSVAAVGRAQMSDGSAAVSRWSTPLHPLLTCLLKRKYRAGLRSVAGARLYRFEVISGLQVNTGP